MIEIKSLSKSFGSNLVLDKFDLTIKEKSIFGLVGINGAGKSTLLRLLAGVYQPDEGEILFGGDNIYLDDEKKKQLFFLPDDLYYSPLMNAQKMSDIYKAFYNFNQSIFDFYINTFRLNPTLTLRSYSKGMKRQLFACLAFACQPKYLLLDEAFDGLDPAARMVFKKGLTDLINFTGGIAIISSHSLMELEDFCDSYGIIDGNRIARSGDLKESLSQVFKFQLAFDRIVAPNDFNFELVSFETTGKIVQIVARGDKSEITRKIEMMNPLIFEESQLDFEEFFIGEVRAASGMEYSNQSAWTTGRKL